MIVKGFWHVFLTNHWYTIVSEQLRIILFSGLYERCQEISIGCIGNTVERDWLQRCFVNLYPKLKIKYWSERPEDYEYPTIRLIQQDHGFNVGFYFHSKGVTHPTETAFNHWRGWLNEAILNQWEVHYNNIMSGYDVSSVNFLKSPDHFSGNFFWFNREYINLLPLVDRMDWSYRWGPEQWICRGKGHYFKGKTKEASRDVFYIKYEKPCIQEKQF